MKHGSSKGVAIHVGLVSVFMSLHSSACGSSERGSSNTASGGAAATGGAAIGGASGGAGGASSANGGTSGASGDSGGSGTSTCTSRAICTSIAIAHVNGLCGTTASSPIPVDQTAPPAQNIDMCLYQNPAGAGQQAVVARYCFTDATTALQYLTGEQARGRTDGGGIETDLAGIGDRAFYRSQVSQKTTSIYAVQGNVLAMTEVDVVSPGTEATVKQCLATLTKEILAL
jgi:hypothetical protein